MQSIHETKLIELRRKMLRTLVFQNWPLQNPKSNKGSVGSCRGLNSGGTTTRTLNREFDLQEKFAFLLYSHSLSIQTFPLLCHRLKHDLSLSNSLLTCWLTYLYLLTFTTNHIYDNNFRHYRSKCDWLECPRSVERATAMPVCRSMSTSARRSISISVAASAGCSRVRSDSHSACMAADKRHAIDSTHFAMRPKQLFLYCVSVRFLRKQIDSERLITVQN